MVTKKKPGRPLSGAAAMTAAERAAKYRAARREAAEAVARRPERSAPTASDVAILDALRLAVAQGSAARVWALTQTLRERYCSKRDASQY